MRSSLHHRALSLSRAEQAAAEAWLAGQNLPHLAEEIPWIGGRGLVVTNPDGNPVELVAYDAQLLDR